MLHVKKMFYTAIVFVKKIGFFFDDKSENFSFLKQSQPYMLPCLDEYSNKAFLPVIIGF